MTVSQSSSTNSSSGIGLRRPFSSGSRAPFSGLSCRARCRRVGQDLDRACRKKNSMPSSFAWRSSSIRAGASASERRYTQRTVACRVAWQPAGSPSPCCRTDHHHALAERDRRVEIGNLSPPIRLTRVRNSLAEYTWPRTHRGSQERRGPAPRRRTRRRSPCRTSAEALRTSCRSPCWSSKATPCPSVVHLRER